MSGQATGWVLRDGPRDRAMRMVLITIADAANRDGEHAHPGMQAIVEGSLYSEGHARRTIAQLIEDGWLEQTEQPGPGKVAEYRIPGVMVDNAAHDARRSEAPGQSNVAQTPREQRADAAHPDARRSELVTVSSNNGDGNGDADVLCNQLATAIGEFRDGDDKRPRITTRWVTDMRLLIERGPPEQANPQPIPVDHVSRMIQLVFSELSDPSGSGFCWAAQIQSPAALRSKWHKLRDALRSKRAAPQRRNGYHRPLADARAETGWGREAAQ